MDKDNSHKRYRGFKYIILAALFFGAVGILFYSNRGQFQKVNPQAEVNEGTESMVAGVKQKGSDLMDKAGEMKGGISDTMAKGREKVSEMTSNLTDKADQMASSATQTGSQWVDKAKSMIDDDGQSNTMAEKVSNASESLTNGLSGEQGRTDEQQMVGDAQSNRFEEQGSNTSDSMTSRFSEEKDKMDAPQMAADTPSDRIEELISEASKTPTGTQDQMETQAAGSPEASDMAKQVAETMTAEPSGSKSVMDASTASSTSTGGSGKEVYIESSPLYIGRCPYPPAKGKDLGTKYIVASCESLSIISERTGVGLSDLIRKNPQVVNPNMIYPDQELRLPPRG